MMVFTLLDESGEAVIGREVEAIIGNDHAVRVVTGSQGTCNTTWTVEGPGAYTVTADFEGDENYLPSSARSEFEVVRFGRTWSSVTTPCWIGCARVPDVSTQATPREMEALVVASGLFLDQRSLEIVISRFEEADYSEHDIERRQFEAMYRAWRILSETDSPMVTRLPLRPALFETALAIAAAVLLWGPQRVSLPPAALQSELLLWAVAAAAGLAFFVDFTLWAQGGSRLRLLLRLPVESKRWLLLPLLITRRLLRDCACLLVILGLLSVAAANRSDPRLFDDLVLGVGGALALLVIVRAASVPFSVANEILRFPLFRLVALAGAYYLINQPWPTTYGFPDSPLFAALGLAMGLSYFGSTLRIVARTSHRWAEEGRVWPRVVAGHLVLTATLSGAVSLALIVWGCVATLPNVSAALLGEWPFDLVGIRTQPLFGLLYGARYLIAGFWMLLNRYQSGMSISR